MGWLLTKLIRGYQRFISPLLPASCRYYPTCSHYAITAIQRFGAVRGGIMATARILRCNPLVPGGIDYVPDHFTVRRNRDTTDNQASGVK